jgi:serine/threonine protein kinase
LVFEVLTGSPPFYDEDPDRSIEKILFEDPELPSHLSEDAEDFLLLVSHGVVYVSEGLWFLP